VDHVYLRLLRPGDEQGFAGEGVYGHARFGPGHVEAGYADAAVFGDAEDAQVEQRVVEDAEGQGVS
jgi:hypothetical protein